MYALTAAKESVDDARYQISTLRAADADRQEWDDRWGELNERLDTITRNTTPPTQKATP